MLELFVAVLVLKLAGQPYGVLSGLRCLLLAICRLLVVVILLALKVHECEGIIFQTALTFLEQALSLLLTAVS